MANAQILVLVRSSAPVPVDAIRTVVEAAAREQRFSPGPWTFDSQYVSVVQNPESLGGLSAVVQGGPWAGETFAAGGTAADPRIPAQGTRQVFNTFRMNLLNGPDSGWSTISERISPVLRALPTAMGSRTAFRTPTSRIAWDRGIPSPIALSAEGSPSSGNGMLIGIAAVAGLAFYAARSSERKRAAFAGVKAKGLRGAPEVHKVQAQRLMNEASSTHDPYLAFELAARASEESYWSEDPETERKATRLWSLVGRDISKLRAGRR